MFGCFSTAYCRDFSFNNLLSWYFKTTGRQITVQFNHTHLVERQQLLQRNRIHAAVVDKSDERRLATFLLLRTRNRLQHTRIHKYTHTFWSTSVRTNKQNRWYTRKQIRAGVKRYSCICPCIWKQSFLGPNLFEVVHAGTRVDKSAVVGFFQEGRHQLATSSRCGGRPSGI